MKSKFKVVAVSLLVIGTLLSQNTKADATMLTNYYSGNFDIAWERYATGDNGKATMTYGYNTRLVDEDYVWAKHSTKHHYASLYNGKGWHTGKGVRAGKLSRVDVRHRGTLVKYCNNF
ncbi:hypothetical protein SAMN05421767_10297 [Granulicatella balaenopterae]|uniref:Bacteriocin (Lactococcin_972) n=1 Tax=Granulicatella balaenopterae TaxID=137733 RepID=A0A1H9HGX9_9LACT|nr:hypothetical protein [Granulicatella balaenopterae]SEQ61565.1 hypothetical protein SAMN05421767_10297 [Granulicatella balaenopterae]